MKLREAQLDNKTKKWLKMADRSYKRIVHNINKFPASDHAFQLVKALKAVEAMTSKDLTNKKRP